MNHKPPDERPLEGRAHLVPLDRDHPGFRDAEYRRRRDDIARLAWAWRDGDPVPDVEYVDDEHAVWRTVWDHLSPLHERYACEAYLEASRALGLDPGRIPQLAEVNQRLEAAHGFTLAPVAGLVSPRVFLEYLGKDIFLATQYMRHCSAPLYTPEPDVVHELVGHAATLLHPGFVELNRLFGAAIQGADEEVEQKLIRVYWWTVEFGVVMEGGARKVYGAGLLSSYGELGSFEEKAELLPLDLERAAATPFDPTDYQRVLFVAPGWDALVREVSTWLRSL